jgi:hypothetical protein
MDKGCVFHVIKQADADKLIVFTQLVIANRVFCGEAIPPTEEKTPTC